MSKKIDELIARSALRYNTHQSVAEREALLKEFAAQIVRQCADAADMAHDANCVYPGDYVVEQLGYGESVGAAIWRTQQ